MSVEQFIARFGGVTEAYHFYKGTVELRYDPKAHIYYRVTGDELVPQDGVTTICHIIDKSEALIPWACKMMAAKLLAEAPTMTLPTGEKVLRQMTYAEYEELVLKSKSAHKEKLEEAGQVGHTAHAWIEDYIKIKIEHDSAADHTLRQIADTKLETHLSKFPTDTRASNCCCAALDWMVRHNVRWLCTERKIYSREWSYAGTMDGLCRVDSCSNPSCCPTPFKNHLTVADWKTSNYLYLEYLLQTAAYMYAYNEEAVSDYNHSDRETYEVATDRWIIRLGKDDGEFQAWYAPVETYQEDIQAFVTALKLKRGVSSIKDRLKARERALKDAEKAAKKAAKETALKVKCKNADKYKGSRKPTCNEGFGCDACRAKYEETQAAKP